MADTSKNQDTASKSYAEELGVSPVSLNVAAIICQLCWYDQHVPLLIGESGIGKTAILRELARFNNQRFELYALAHMESTDLTGPMYASRTKPDAYTFLRDGRLPFQGYDDSDDMVLIATDEANRAEMTTLNAAFPLWTERRIGPHKLGPNAVVAAAMNPPEGDYAVTSQFSTDPAMRRRVCQIYVSYNPSAWLEWARSPGNGLKFPEGFDPVVFEDDFAEKRRAHPIHPAVINYVKARPDMGLDKASRDAGKVYACPATWEQVSDTLHTLDERDFNLDNALVRRAVSAKISGHVGAATAYQVLDFYEEVTDVIQPREVLLDYRPGTPVYKKIHKAINNGDHAVLASMIKGVAQELHGPEELEFDVYDTIPCLAELYHDLPPQQMKQLDSERIEVEDQRTGSSAGGGDGGLKQRMMVIQMALQKEEKFQNAKSTQMGTYRNAQTQMLQEEAKMRENARNNQS